MVEAYTQMTNELDAQFALVTEASQTEIMKIDNDNQRMPTIKSILKGYAREI